MAAFILLILIIKSTESTSLLLKISTRISFHSRRCRRKSIRSREQMGNARWSARSILNFCLANYPFRGNNTNRWSRFPVVVHSTGNFLPYISHTRLCSSTALTIPLESPDVEYPFRRSRFNWSYNWFCLTFFCPRYCLFQSSSQWPRAGGLRCQEMKLFSYLRKIIDFHSIGSILGWPTWGFQEQINIRPHRKGSSHDELANKVTKYLFHLSIFSLREDLFPCRHGTWG